MTIELTINDQKISAEPGQTIIEAARAHGITIPTLCYHKDLSPVGSCRLCVVEIEGMRGEHAACTTRAANGMVVHTETPALFAHRQLILEFLLQNYYDAGYALGDREADTEFIHWVKTYQAQLPKAIQPRYQVDSDPNPFVWVDMNKCILCTRCVRACAEIQGRYVWGVGERGKETKIIAGADTTMLAARCESCGACVAYCPTGALDNRIGVGKGAPEKIVTTTCSYCGVGCQFDLNVIDNHIVRVTSNPEVEPNGMHLCVKGRYGFDYVQHPDRLRRPRVRKYLLEGKPKSREGDNYDWVETDWDTALDITARKLVQIKRESGPNALGVLASAKCTNEENYLMQKFSRQILGTHNVDHCARLCHAPTVAGLAATLGSGAMTNPFKDIANNAKAVLIIGSNTTEQHPVFGSMLRHAAAYKGLKIIVADPRRIDITEFATLHIRQKPGTDVALVNGLMHIILKNGWEDRDYIEARTENFEALAETLERYTPEEVSRITGISIPELYQTAELLAKNKPMAVIWAMGITQHTKGVLNVMSLSNLQLMLGNLGVPGGGVNPLRGQNNVQGACDMGGLPNVFSGYQAVANPDANAKFNQAWALSGSETLFNNIPGLTVTELVHNAGDGKIRGLYILGENPAMSDPDVNHATECLEKCEFILLQEIFPSESAAFADVLLPGVSFVEKEGTFTNSERRLRMVRQALQPFGEARQDWAITTDLAKRILDLEGKTPVGPYAAWPYENPAQILSEIAALTPIYAGVTYDRLENGEQLCWPVRGLDHPGTPILHIGQFPLGKAKFVACEHLDAKELPDEEYPYYLTTGRVIYHWHGAEMTRRSQGLLEIYPETLIEINPEDAFKVGLNGKDTLRVTSRRGEMIARAIVTERVPAGLVFANFHFPGEQNANNLTINAVDPTAKIPEYKVCAVKISLA